MADGSDIVEQSREIIRDGDRCGSAAKHPTTILTRQLMEKLCDELERLRAQAPVWRTGIEAAAKVAEDTTRAVARGDFGLIGPAGIGMRIAAEIRALLEEGK